MNINSRSVGQIHLSMHQEDVESLLGGPPGDYSSGIHDITYPGEPALVGVVFKEWRSDEGIIRVGFDEEGCVAGVRYTTGFLPGKTSPANGTTILPPGER
jgi:hypothetical protein